MSREQLEHYAKKILEEMERVREECNFFQLERDKIRTFWEITRNQLHEAQATVRYNNIFLVNYKNLNCIKFSFKLKLNFTIFFGKL